jgi:ATP-dependent Lhr-like helicase
VSVFGRFPPRLQEAIVARLGWSSLRPVQEQAGEALLSGANAVILAPTAGGKTEAAMFPVLANLVEDQSRSVAAIYVAPIKALLNNQSARLDLYTEMVGLRRCVWHGDTSAAERRRFLSDPTDLLMTTPESLEVMLISPRVDADALFADLRFVVVDEIHALAGTDRGAHLISVLERLNRRSRHDVQRIGLSATVGNPAVILDWLSGTSARAGLVVSPKAEPRSRELRVIYRPALEALAGVAAKVARGGKSLFFCQTRAVTEAVAEHMQRLGTSTFVHHSAVSKEERELAEERFHSDGDACIVCTSTLELGIDVGDLDLVLQADAPATVGSFLQRMGRTGRRAGQRANTTFLCETPDAVLQAVAVIELAKAGWVESVRVNDRCWPVLIHQVIALALEANGRVVEEIWGLLRGVPDFRGIKREEFDALIDWMCRERWFLIVGGRLVVGPETERRFGRRNFMDIYSVFSSPQSYSVQSAEGRPLGSLNQDFVDRLVEDVSCFLLGGRAWAVAQVHHDDRRIVVTPAPRGKQPTWGGFLPQFLGFELCQKSLEVLCGEETYSYLTPPAHEALQVRRGEMTEVVDARIGGVELDDDEIRWWTFAGGAVNSTLRYAIGLLQPDWAMTADNFLIRIRGEAVTGRSFLALLDRLQGDALWKDGAFWDEASASLPGYRLSKFQPLMPPWVEREVLTAYLFDTETAETWLGNAVRRAGSAGAGP